MVTKSMRHCKMQSDTASLKYNKAWARPQLHANENRFDSEIHFAVYMYTCTSAMIGLHR